MALKKAYPMYWLIRVMSCLLLLKVSEVRPPTWSFGLTKLTLTFSDGRVVCWEPMNPFLRSPTISGNLTPSIVSSAFT